MLLYGVLRMVLVKYAWLSQRVPNIQSLKNNSLNVLMIRVTDNSEFHRIISSHCFLISRVLYMVLCSVINQISAEKSGRHFLSPQVALKLSFEFLVSGILEER